jgi:Insertion element 4 transposase N-terminal/Transposase DDE domain
MARTVAGLPEGSRVSDYITFGVLAERIPVDVVHEVLRQEGRQSQRQRRLPAHVMVYYVVALALYMQVSYGEVLRCLVEGLQWLGWPVKEVRQTGRSAISQARTRLGFEPLKRLYEEVVGPIATTKTRGAHYRQWNLISLDGSTLDVPDEAGNSETFGRVRASRGKSAFPQLRFVSLVECGTHVLFGAAQGPYNVSEVTLARDVVDHLCEGMLCVADRYFYGYALWQKAAQTGAELLWRMKKNALLPCQERLEDGSYLSIIYPTLKDRRHEQNGHVVRVVEYALDGDQESEPCYRLMTTILDPALAPAKELAALYMERWEIETAFDEFKTHLRGSRVVLRSKTPDLVRQEFYGLLLAHYAVRGLMHEAALRADLDPDTLSFVHSVRVVRRKLQEPYGPGAAPFPPSGNGNAS